MLSMLGHRDKQPMLVLNVEQNFLHLTSTRKATNFGVEGRIFVIQDNRVNQTNVRENVLYRVRLAQVSVSYFVDSFLEMEKSIIGEHTYLFR